MTPSTVGVHGNTAQISRDEVFDVLSNQRRICVLRYLNQVEEEIVELRDIVDYVAACEHADSADGVDYQARKSVYTALRQTHLPKLDELGVIEFDKSRGEIRLAERADRVQLYLEYVPENDIPWHVHYLGLTALSGFLLATTYVGLYPFGMGWNHLAVTLFAILSISAVVHTIHTRGNRLEEADFEPIEK